MGKISKGKGCDVAGCEASAERSVPIDRATKAGLKLNAERRAYLCSQHYKEMKKKLKKDARFEKWRHMG
ncbi:MAG: hypothetical protein QW057_06985 [Candidatus Bathyarchaeia archaeon]